MSLFICSGCNNIENTALVGSTLTGTKPDNNYPNLHLQEMMEASDDAKHSVMLCELCNTGNFHHQFPYDKATPGELELAAHSDYGMITPFDHDPDVIMPDPSSPHGYRKTSGIHVKSKPLSLNIPPAIVAGTGIPSRPTEKDASDDRALRLAELKRAIKSAKRDPN